MTEDANAVVPSGGKPADGQTRISVWIGYLATIAIELVLTRLLIAVHGLLPLGQFPIYYVLVIMLVAYVFGEGPAVLAFFLGLFAFDYLFIPPLHTPLPHPETPAAWASLISYLTGTSIVGFATVMIRRSKRRVQRAAEKLRESEERLRLAQSVAKVGVGDWNMETGVNTWTPALEAMYGLPPGGFDGTQEAFIKLVYPDDLPEVERRVEESMETGEFEAEWRVIWPDGTVHWLYARTHVFKDESGKPVRMLGVNIDITDRKQAEEALETARKAAEYGKSRLEAVLEALPVGMAITDAKGGVVMVNKAYEQLWSGHPSTKSIKDYAAFKAWWVDTGKPVAPEEWASAQAVRKGKSVEGQLLRIQRFDGSHAFVLNSASPIRDAAGNIVGSAVAIQDVTPLREAEEARARSVYTRELIEVSLDPLVAIGPDGKITDVNKATEDVTGVSRDKLIGSDFSTYFTEPKKARAGYQQVFSKGFVRDYPLAIRHSSGRVTEVLYNAAVYRDESGNVSGVFAAARDITALRKVEEMQRQRELEEHKLEFYRRTIAAATDGKLMITDADEIFNIAGEASESWEIAEAGDVAVVRHGVERIAQSAGLKDPKLGQLIVAAGEAATNAFKHAKMGKVSIHGRDGTLIVVISDRGPGIPALALPEVALTPGFSTAGTLGMGYKLIISFADKVYLATGAEGTTVGIQMGL